MTTTHHQIQHTIISEIEAASHTDLMFGWQHCLICGVKLRKPRFTCSYCPETDGMHFSAGVAWQTTCHTRAGSRRDVAAKKKLEGIRAELIKLVSSATRN